MGWPVNLEADFLISLIKDNRLAGHLLPIPVGHFP